MIKKRIRLFILLIFIILSSGCETAQGMRKDYEKIKDWDLDFKEVLW